MQMNSPLSRPPLTLRRRSASLLVLALALGACADGQQFDFDLRGLADGFTTAPAAQNVATAPRPEPDARGVVTYPNYQVAIARRGDTITSVAARVGLPASELARYNGIPEDVVLTQNEVIALPRRIDGSGAGTASGTIATGERIDVVSLGNAAIADAERNGGATMTQATPSAPLEVEPVRHQVQRGETAYSIARLYGVPVRALAEWNGLGGDLAVQEGRYLLIPVTTTTPPAAAESSPGQGTATPTPPSAAAPLPAPESAAAPASSTPDLGETQTASADMAPPVSGAIIRDYDESRSKSLLFSASAGTPVKAAKDGTVNLVSRNAEGVEFVVIDHGGGIQSAYSFLEGITVERGTRVTRGQTIGKAAQNEFNAVQFMVFNGTQTVDPTPYLN